jgi:phosphoribosylamine--glycine ligase
MHPSHFEYRPRNPGGGAQWLENIGLPLPTAMKSINILLLGSGGREHAFALALSQSPYCQSLYIAPGNPGTAQLGTNVALDWRQTEDLAAFVTEHSIELLVVGPEDPLVHGLRDTCAAHPALQHLLFIGPGAAGAQLEGSKDFSKDFMARQGIPTADHQTFTAAQVEEGCAFLATLNPPYVLKADGLAAGKGVLILDHLDEAQQELRSMLVDAKFGAASAKVVVEEFLAGIEFSVFALTDGKHYVLLPEAKDYKRIGEGDMGLNTGGMGAVSPVSFCTPDVMAEVERTIVAPTVAGLQKENIPYVGFLFFGLIRCSDAVKVIEYNCRMGDPETEAVLPRLDEDLVALLSAAAEGRLENRVAKQKSVSQCVVVSVAGGYPGDYGKGDAISGLDSAAQDQHSTVFHAGTRQDGNIIRTNGGRVLAVSSRGNTTQDALDAAFDTMKKIHYSGQYYRRDIGQDLI